MRIEQLEYFLDVAKTNSLNISAERLFVTQPTISESIHKLEEELDTELLIRSKKGVSLTETGHIVQRWAETILQDVALMQNEIFELQNGSNPKLFGDICIGASNIVSKITLPDIMEGFSKHYPNIAVTNFYVRHYEIPEFLINETMDIAIVNFFHCESLPFNHIQKKILEETSYEKFFEEPIYVIASKNLPICKKKQITLQELVNYPLAITQTQLSEDNGVLQILRQYGKTNIVLKTDNINLMTQSILNERCIGLFTKSAYHKTLRNEVENSALVRMIKLKENVTLQFYICLKKEKKLTMAEKAFIVYLKEAIKQGQK